MDSARAGEGIVAVAVIAAVLERLIQFTSATGFDQPDALVGRVRVHRIRRHAAVDDGVVDLPDQQSLVR